MVYKIYDLILESDINIQELIEVKDYSGKIDIKVTIEKLPDYIKNKINIGIKIEEKKDKVWYNIPELGVFLIENGTKIRIFPIKGVDEDRFKTYILGTSLGMIMIQRNRVAVHGGTIVLNDGSVIITGESGAGKSSLTSAFRMKGFKFLADDVSVIDFDSNKQYIVTPAFPQQKLCRDTVMKLGLDIKDYKLINRERIKYAIPVKDEFEGNSKPLKGIFFLSVSDVNNVEVEELKGEEKLQVLLNNIFRIEYGFNTGIQGGYFKNLLNIVKNVPIYKIVRPKEGFTVEEQINKILEWRECV